MANKRQGAARTQRGEHRQRWSVGQLLLQSGKDLATDNAPQWAAAVAYYTLLSLFPLLLAAASIAAFFVSPQWAVGQVMRLLGDFLPESGGAVNEVVRNVIDARGTASLLSIGLLLWTGSRVFGSLTRALNIAFDTDETYSFGKRLLVELGMLLTLGLLFLLAVSSGFLLNLLWQALGIPPAERGGIFSLVNAAVPAALLLATFFLVYRFVPRTRPDWKAALGGAAVATLLFLLARPLFAYYVREFAGYNLIYGSLSIVIILLVWSWLSALIVLFGGEIASHIQMLWLEGRSCDEVRRRHEARSPDRSVSDRARDEEWRQDGRRADSQIAPDHRRRKGVDLS